MTYVSLEEALTSGRGVERPFNCPTHGDTNASASVNVIKGVWCCFACKASGTVEGNRAPSPEDLAIMLGKGEGARAYPEAYLEVFTNGDWASYYWASRFEPYAGRAMGLGHDPFTGEATFPVRHPDGRLAGLGRRAKDPEARPRYRYPWGWSAASTMFGGLRGRKISKTVTGVLVLVEGAADATSIVELGANALACYGSGLHLPQRETIARYNPQLIITAFDNDEAGRKGTVAARAQLKDLCSITTVNWPLGGDPASTDPADRWGYLIDAVTRSGYREIKQLINGWQDTQAYLFKRYGED